MKHYNQSYKLKEEFSRIDSAKDRICDPKKQPSKRETSQGEKRQKLPEKICSMEQMMNRMKI